MEEYIADLMSYEQLQKKVIKNEEAILRFSKTVGDSSVGTVVPDRSRQLRGAAGTVTLYNESSGLKLDENNDNRLCIASATVDDIDEGISVNKPIVPANFAYALRQNMYNRNLFALDSEDEELHEKSDMPTSANLVKAYVDYKAAHYRGNFSDVGMIEGTLQNGPNDFKLVEAYTLKNYVENIAAYDGSILDATKVGEDGSLPKDSSRPVSAWAVAQYVFRGDFTNCSTLDVDRPASGSAVKNFVYKDDISKIDSKHPDKDRPASALAVKNLIMPNLLNFKMATIAKGETFTITPGMLALILPYGDYTLSAHKADGTEIATGMGTTMIFSAERDEAYGGDYWAAFLYAKNAVLGATVSSNHNRYSTDCYIKNNYSGNEGSGMAYVYYLS